MYNRVVLFVISSVPVSGRRDGSVEDSDPVGSETIRIWDCTYTFQHFLIRIRDLYPDLDIKLNFFKQENVFNSSIRPVKVDTVGTVRYGTVPTELFLKENSPVNITNLLKFETETQFPVTILAFQNMDLPHSMNNFFSGGRSFSLPHRLAVTCS